MYEEHPTFVQPRNEEVKVWRYMDFTKLISLLDAGHLFFTRADKFNDPFEGSYPKANVQERKRIPEVWKNNMPKEAKKNHAKHLQYLIEMHKDELQYTAINCWHMNEHESAAMWNLYLKSNEGIAIQSTYSRLKKSLLDEQVIYLGIVKYIDYDTEHLDSGNIFSPFVHKRKSFEHVREVRAVINFFTHKEGIPYPQKIINFGVQIKTDLEILIERIYIAPSSPPWFTDLVRSVVDKYGYNFEIVSSRLNDRPLF